MMLIINLIKDTMKPKIYDCFCYFNEAHLLELRLETLWDVVDYFVICESMLTIAGQPKPLYFKPENFVKYKDKIRHLIVESYPFDTSDAWRNERWQRDYLVKGLFDAQDDDWIIVSDVDEIPKPEAIFRYNPSLGKRGDFQQNMYAYYLNNRWEVAGCPVTWVGSKITTFKIFKNFFNGSAENLRNHKFTGMLRNIKRVYFRKFLTQKISDGGWHFTWMAGIDKIIQKLESFAHQEFNKPEYKNSEKIKELITSGKDVLFPDRLYEIQVLDMQFPEYLVKNQDRFRSYLLEK
jgi:beta-1,4-mannosyl-glycoprotein beta-1,4-N-acetylglucosaminyltransferase